MTWNTDVQANILRGLPAEWARYLFISFDSNEAQADLKNLLSKALPHVEDANWQADRFPRGSKLENAVVNLALTRKGLELATGATYVSDEVVRDSLAPGGGIPGVTKVADAFSERKDVPTSIVSGSVNLDPKAVNSMYRRLDLVGEAPIKDQEAAHSWDPTRWNPQQVIHLLVWISGPSKSEMIRISNEILPAQGVNLVHRITAQNNPGHLGWFGFKDGVGQPAVEGFHSRSEMFGRGAWSEEGWRGLKPGEFIIGEEDEGGERRRPQPGDVLHNGTFLVFREIQMYADRLEQLIKDNKPTGLPEDEVASWLVGRNRPGNGNDGTSLMTDGPRENRDFIYAHDPEGLRCPLGAHIRRANPRDTLGKWGRRTNRHRIIRRGMPYKIESTGEQGLAFIALQARIEDQFEFIQAHWLNTGPTLHAGADPDPIAGNKNADVDQPRFVKQGNPAAVLELRPSPLSEVRGGEYFVMPTVPSLHKLAKK